MKRREDRKNGLVLLVIHASGQKMSWLYGGRKPLKTLDVWFAHQILAALVQCCRQKT